MPKFEPWPEAYQRILLHKTTFPKRFRYGPDRIYERPTL